MLLSFFEKWLSVGLAGTLVIIFYQRSCLIELQNHLLKSSSSISPLIIKTHLQRRSKRSLLEYSVEAPPEPLKHLITADKALNRMYLKTTTKSNNDDLEVVQESDQTFYFPLYTQLSVSLNFFYHLKITSFFFLCFYLFFRLFKFCKQEFFLKKKLETIKRLYSLQ